MDDGRVFGAIALLVGSGTTPLFATLPLWSMPFCIAASTLGTAALLCWVPFWIAVRV